MGKNGAANKYNNSCGHSNLGVIAKRELDFAVDSLGSSL